MGIRGNITRTNLAYANEHRDWRVYEALDQVSFISAQRFALDDFSKDPFSLSVSFPSRVGHAYTVEGTSGFSGWSDIDTGIMGTGTVLHRTYALPTGEPTYFFRVSESE